MNGWIVVDKPVGPGSTQVVSAVKRALRAGGYPKVKVGHGGTLDPLASGVLPVALGEATKLAGRMLDSDKAYAFAVAWGTETDTLDAEGRVTETSDVVPSPAEIQAILPRFTGPIEQVPPAFSALKVDGRRAYDLARAGAEVTLATRAVTVHALSHREGVFTAHVSKGTYIRSLARDIARALGSVAHVTMLRRIRAGPFTLESAISLDRLADLGHGRDLEDVTLPLTAGLDDIPALSVTPDQAGLLRQGRVLVGIAAHHGLHLAIDGNCPVALVDVSDAGVRVVRGFNL
jgi:tRNA pseudouridine55 synthase